jgi:pyruvate/2-oxoglutarate/acetoin dehydrogenase E1 component
MANKPYRYAVLEAVANEMRANPDMVYIYEYQSPVAVGPAGEILNLAKEFGPVRTSGDRGGWPLDDAWYVGCATGIAMTGAPVVC